MRRSSRLSGDGKVPGEAKKKRARFAAKEEKHAFKKGEKIGTEIDRIFDGDDEPATTVKTARSLKRVSSVTEEELQWDANEDYSTAFALDGLGAAKVKVTRDTQDLSLAELREELKARSLSTQGGREALLARLEEAIVEEKETEKAKEKENEREKRKKTTKEAPQTKKEVKESPKTKKEAKAKVEKEKKVSSPKRKKEMKVETEEEEKEEVKEEVKKETKESPKRKKETKADMTKKVSPKRTKLETKKESPKSKNTSKQRKSPRRS